MTKQLGRFALSDPVTVLVSPYVDWWDESQESGVVPEPIQGQLPVAKPAPAKRQRRKQSPPVAAKFNPAEPRDEDGKWSLVGAIRDLLKLAGKIDLGKDEHLLGSGKVDADQGGFRIASLDRSGTRVFRVGIGGENYGQRNRDDGIPAWDGNPPLSPVSPEKRLGLEAEADLLDAKIDSGDLDADSEEALIDRRNEIRRRLDAEFNQTAEVDEYTLDRLVTKVNAAMAEATELDDLERKIDQLEREQDKLRFATDPTKKWTAEQEAHWDSLTEQIDALKAKDRAPGAYATFVEGVLPGSKWGDIHYQVYLDEPSYVYDEYGGGGGPTLLIGVAPKGVDVEEWGSRRDWQGSFLSSEWRKLLRLIQSQRAKS